MVTPSDAACTPFTTHGEQGACFGTLGEGMVGPHHLEDLRAMNVRRMLASAGFGAALLLSAGPAAAQTSYVGTPPSAVNNSDSGRPTQVAGVQVERGLAVTGGDVAGLAVLGAGAIGVGMLLKRAGRRPEEV